MLASYARQLFVARFLVQVCLLALVSLFAWRRGGGPEKAAAVALLASLAIDQTYHALVAAPLYRQLDLWHMSLDVAMLAVMVGLALRSPRVWLLWMASLQTISALGHVLHVIELAMPVVVYWAMITAPSWLQILLLAAGTYLNDQRRQVRQLT